MITYDWALLLSCLCLILVLAGLVYDLLRGNVKPRVYEAPEPREVGPCTHCGKSYGEHEAKRHYCPNRGGWSEVTFEEASRE